MSNIVNITSSPYNIFPNSFSYFFCLSGSEQIILPTLYEQKETITIINNSTINLIIRDNDFNTIITISNNSFVSLVSDSFAWKIVNFVDNASFTGDWRTDGNSGLTGGKLGTLESNNFDIIRGGMPYLQLQFSGLLANVPLSMQTNKITNLDDPTLNLDAANKIYVDTMLTNLQTTITNYINDNLLLPLVPISQGPSDDRSGWRFGLDSTAFAGDGSTPFSGGNNTTLWQPLSGTTNSIIVQGPYPTILRGIVVQPGNVVTLDQILILGSNNGSAFVTIFEDDTPKSPNSFNFIKFPNIQGAFLYYSLQFTFSGLGNSGIRLLQLYGRYP